MTERRVAFVTGGSRGIGAAIAKRLAKDGLHVVAVARSADKLQQVVNEIKSEGGAGGLIAALTALHRPSALSSFAQADAWRRQISTDRSHW